VDPAETRPDRAPPPPVAKIERPFYFGVVGKGEQTRTAILDRALAMASEQGLEGLTIGRLAEVLELSKSGLFAHFGSKEALQVETLEHAAEQFVDAVLRPALSAPKGEPRVRALFERWVRWPEVVPQPGGCIFVAAAAELDDRPGPARDVLVRLQREWLATLATAFRGAQKEGHLRPDPPADQLAFELLGIMLACHQAWRLLGDRDAPARARRAFDRLLEGARPR
jgi:AcrR family transcriptional regulator